MRVTETVVLFGSPHKDGATAQLTDAFLAALTGGDRVTVVDCYARAAVPCTDCGGCRTQTRCVHRDLDDVYAAIERADRLVVATPIHNRSFSAPLKTVIDRLQPYWCARFVRGIKPPIEKPKKVVLLLTCDSAADREDARVTEEQLRPVLTVLNAAFCGTVCATECRGACGDLSLDEAAALAQSL